MSAESPAGCQRNTHKSAAENNYVIAQYNLALCYYCGRGTLQNYDKALIWCKRAAEQGNADAQFFTGVCYEYGQGVERNEKEAINWYKIAAKQGSQDAQKALIRLDVET